ncbi:hypothetical protein BDF21DRAFT_80268 [Thamnidium elegans]|uniref:DASH complex subunit DAM1 n=1 Tax=Thamnidium elegans TaxID=101142 RepID=A0A8H7SMX6_9FUNG|nr:hypothetical protein INT48_003390 [Thamnidium elegans]KAI8071883.1 hypothetical protein BDF21DRAFT_80268 [Thamnidium elegans]
MTSNNQTHDFKSFADLTKPLVAINKSFSTMQRRFEKLHLVNNELVKFNDAFSAFLYGITVTNTAVEWTQAPTEMSLQEFREHNKTKSSLESLAGPIKDFKEPAITATHIENSKKRKAPPTTSEPVKSKRRFVSNVNIKSIIDRLPLMYRDQTEHMENMKQLLKTLRLHPNGLSMKDLVTAVKLPQYKVTTCINALIHSKDAIKSNEKGAYSKYLLDPEKFPSIEKKG